MKRRSALAAVLATLAGCGGGSSESELAAPPIQNQEPTTPPAPAAPPPPAPPPAPTQQPAPPPPIALWGDSLTAGYAPGLAALYPERTIYNGGIHGNTSSQIVARQLADTAHENWTSVLWYGHNNRENPEQTKVDIAASVADLKSRGVNFLVLGMSDGATNIRGTTYYDTLIRLNEDLAATYPDNYLDIRAWLVSLYDPTNPQDLADHATDVIPTSLRDGWQHFNAAGSEAIARKVKEFIDAKGW